MNRKKTIARVAAGFLSVVTFLSSVIGPVPAMAADPDSDSGYIEDYPELKEVRDMLDEDEIVQADDITVDADEEFEIKKDFKGIDYSSRKVKISLYDDDGFSPSKEGSYKPVYHADPKSGNHGYRFSRRITVVKREEKKEASASATAGSTGSGSESHGENTHEHEEGSDDAEDGNEPKKTDSGIESSEEVPSNEVKEAHDPEMHEPESDLLRADGGKGNTSNETSALQEEGTAGEEASSGAEMKDDAGSQENGGLLSETTDNASKDSTTAAVTKAQTDTVDEASTEADAAAERSVDETATEGSTDKASEDATAANADAASEDATAASTEAASENATAAGSDAATADAAVAATAEVPAEESGKSVQEIAMTVDEFETAFEKVTAPSLAASASVNKSASANNASGAKIISKENEIDYEDLGIGEDVHGHLGHTTPVRVVDSDGNTYVGICAVPDDRGWSRGSELPEVSRVTDTLIIKYYYYTMLDSYGEDLARSRGFGSNSREIAIAACHEAIGERYAKLAGIEYDRPNVGSNLRALVNA